MQDGTSRRSGCEDKDEEAQAGPGPPLQPQMGCYSLGDNTLLMLGLDDLMVNKDS